MGVCNAVCVFVMFAIVVFTAEPGDWLGRMSLRLPNLLSHVGCTSTLTQYSILRCVSRKLMAEEEKKKIEMLEVLGSVSVRIY